MTAKLRPAAGAAPGAWAATGSGAGAASGTGARAASGSRARAALVRSPRVVLLAAVLVAVLAGCGSTPAGPSTRASAPAAIRLPLATTLTESGGTSWAVIDMGGSSAKLENFWQLFARPATASAASAAGWSLATPPGVADNGGLVTAPLGGPALVTGFNPSQDLKFSPLATTRDGGTRWAPGLLPAGLAAVPSALAAGPGGRLIALTNRGLAEITAAGGAGWTRLASLTSLAATPAARSCGLAPGRARPARRARPAARQRPAAHRRRAQHDRAADRDHSGRRGEPHRRVGRRDRPLGAVGAAPAGRRPDTLHRDRHRFRGVPRPGRHRRPPQSGQRGRGHPEHRARRDDH
jgi:hypothetical protein